MLVAAPTGVVNSVLATPSFTVTQTGAGAGSVTLSDSVALTGNGVSTIGSGGLTLTDAASIALGNNITSSGTSPLTASAGSITEVAGTLSGAGVTLSASGSIGVLGTPVLTSASSVTVSTGAASGNNAVVTSNSGASVNLNVNTLGSNLTFFNSNGGNININGNITSLNNGNIDIEETSAASAGSITDTSSPHTISSSGLANGAGGNITLKTLNGAINIGSDILNAQGVNNNNNGGTIQLLSTGGGITTGAIEADASVGKASGTGVGGSITVTAATAGSSISTGAITATSQKGVNTATNPINVSVTGGGTILIAGQINDSATQAGGNGFSGPITLNAGTGAGNTLTVNGNITSNVAASGNGTAGAITLSGGTGGVEVDGSIDSRSNNGTNGAITISNASGSTFSIDTGSAGANTIKNQILSNGTGSAGAISITDTGAGAITFGGTSAAPPIDSQTTISITAAGNINGNSSGNGVLTSASNGLVTLSVSANNLNIGTNVSNPVQVASTSLKIGQASIPNNIYISCVPGVAALTVSSLTAAGTGLQANHDIYIQNNGANNGFNVDKNLASVAGDGIITLNAAGAGTASIANNITTAGVVQSTGAGGGAVFTTNGGTGAITMSALDVTNLTASSGSGNITLTETGVIPTSNTTTLTNYAAGSAQVTGGHTLVASNSTTGTYSMTNSTGGHDNIGVNGAINGSSISIINSDSTGGNPATAGLISFAASAGTLQSSGTTVTLTTQGGNITSTAGSLTIIAKTSATINLNGGSFNMTGAAGQGLSVTTQAGALSFSNATVITTGGAVALSATGGNIQNVGTITTNNAGGAGGSISLDSTSITTGALSSTGSGANAGGAINIGQNITPTTILITGTINSSSASGNAGAVNIKESSATALLMKDSAPAPPAMQSHHNDHRCGNEWRRISH